MPSVLATCTVVALSLMQGAVAGASEPDGLLKALQGTWTGTETGHEVQGSCTLKFDGNSLHFRGWNKEEWYKGTIQLAPGMAPMKARATIAECPIPDFVGKQSNSIVRLENGTLTVAARRPGDPQSPSGFDDPEARQFVLKKTSD